MRKIISILVLLGSLGLAGCQEYTAPVEGTNKILVIDADGQPDLQHIAKACGGINKIADVQLVKDQGDGAPAIVECR